jgi:hypothetical protein
VSSLPLSQTSSEIQFGDRNLRFLEAPSKAADKRIFSPAKRQLREMPYYFSCITALLFTEQSVYFLISNPNEIITQWSLPMRLINFSISYGKIMTSQCSPVITYIYLCRWLYASCLSYISTHPSQTGQKLNWNVIQALEKPFTIGILSYMESWCLVPFSSNIYCDCTIWFL